MSFQTTARGKVYNNIIETIGGTPLVKLETFMKNAGCSANILAKLEFFNPLSSVKDRAAIGMIESAEQDGSLKPGGTIVEATSGNTGIGLAYIAAVKGYKLILTMPKNMSVERQNLLTFLGAEIELTPAETGMVGAVKRAEEIVAKTDGAIAPRQFENPANPAIHMRTTAQEIWEDTEGKVDVFIAGVGTGGTIQGVGSALKEKNPNLKVIAIEPSSSPVLSGGKACPHSIQGIGANFIPKLLDLGLIDEIVNITDEESFDLAQALAKTEGILAGISSGAAVAGALKIAMRPEMDGKTIVTILPDGAERYLSTKLFNRATS